MEVGPADASASVVFLHGLGSSASDLAPIVRQLALPCRFVLPDAPVRPVTMNQGASMASWYDVGPDGSPSYRDVLASRERLEQRLLREGQRIGFERLVIGGFSQGGAMALHVAERFPADLAGVFVLSGYRFDFDGPTPRRTPALFCHGIHDDVLSMHVGYNAYRDTAEPGRDVRWQTFEGRHEVSWATVGMLWHWLMQMLG